MHLDGYKYWLAYKKGLKCYYRCSRSKSQKCPGKLIMESSKIISSTPHDHDKEARNNAVEKFRKVLTKKAIEKPNKSLVDIYLEETLNHSEASILYPFTQAESTMRKARSKTFNANSERDRKSNKNDSKLIKNKEKINKTEEVEQSINFKSQQHQKYFYVEDIGNDIHVILMNQATLKILGKVEEVHIDCGLKGDLRAGKVKEFRNSNPKSIRNKMDASKCIGSMKNVQDPDHLRVINDANQLYANPKTIENGDVYVVNPENPNTHQNSVPDQNYEINEQIHTKNPPNDSINHQKINCHESFTNNKQNNPEGGKNSMKPIESYSCDITPTTSEPIYEHVQFFEHKESEINESHEMGIDFEFEKQNFDEISINYDFGGVSTKTNDFNLYIPQNSNSVNQSKTEIQNHAQVNHSDQFYEVIMSNSTENLVKKFETYPPSVTIIAESGRGSKQTTSNLIEIQQTSSVINRGCQKSDDSVNQLHVITIIALIKGRDCPIAFGLLKSISFDSVHHFLNFVKLKISLNPSIILTDKNHILQQSIHILWPEANLKIMYFYYAQSVMKNLKKNFQEITKNIFEISSLKMILSMPMIPTNYVIPGWEALRKWMSEKNVNLNCLCDEVYTHWLADNAERISIFNGLTHSINNYTQVFQSELLNSFDGNQMDLIQLTEKISRQATKNFIKFTKTSENTVKKIQKLQKTVKIATKNWISSPFHLRRPIQFLQQVSHCIDDGMMSFVMNFDGSFCQISKRSEPPPLVFFVKEQNDNGAAVNSVQANKVNLLSDPPPLIPIMR